MCIHVRNFSKEASVDDQFATVLIIVWISTVSNGSSLMSYLIYLIKHAPKIRITSDERLYKYKRNTILKVAIFVEK